MIVDLVLISADRFIPLDSYSLSLLLQFFALRHHSLFNIALSSSPCLYS